MAEGMVTDAEGRAPVADDPKIWDLTVAEVKRRVNRFEPGRGFRRGQWPDGKRVGVLLSFDIDNECLTVSEGANDAFTQAVNQFGGRRGVERILRMLERHEVPATFFTPVMSLLLKPELVTAIRKSGRHEFATHGWIHESPADLSDEEHFELLTRVTGRLHELTGEHPVGYRAPLGILTDRTFGILSELGYIYDSSLMSDDLPFELLENGSPTGLVELPPSLDLEDSLLDPLNSFSAGYLSPGDVLQIYRGAFDVAHAEGGMLLSVMHPHVTGKMSCIGTIEGFIEYAKSHEGVWFGTHADAARHFRSQLAGDGLGNGGHPGFSGKPSDGE